MIIKIRRQRASARQGATAVEFALVAPILFLVIFACIEFARLMITVSVIEQSAFEAARHVAVLGSTVADGEKLIRQELGIFGIDDPQINIVGLRNGAEQSEIDDGSDQISVDIIVHYEDFMIFNTGGQNNIERKAVVNTERY